MFKPSESSIFGQSKNLSDKVADQKNMFSSLRDWGSSFSLRDWIPKGISLSFGKKNDAAMRDTFAPETDFLGDISTFTTGYDPVAAHKVLADENQWQYNNNK